MSAEKVHVLRLNVNTPPPPTPFTEEVNPEPGRAEGASRENPGDRVNPKPYPRSLQLRLGSSDFDERLGPMAPAVPQTKL